MFGGIAFLRHGLMFVGVSDSALMARVGKRITPILWSQHVRPMDFTANPCRVMSSLTHRDQDRGSNSASARALRAVCVHASQRVPSEAHNNTATEPNPSSHCLATAASPGLREQVTSNVRRLMRKGTT